MMTQQMFEQGLAYAESNFKNENAAHLHVDKRLIREKFNMDGKRVLDFGCGMGGMSLWYATNFKCEVHGIDIDRHHISIANALKDKYKASNVNFEVRNVLENPIEGKYDFIVLNDVAEHIQLPILKAIFQALSKNLANNGGIYVSYPPWRSPYASHVQHVVGIPWCQFLPQGVLMKMIEKNNQQIVGEEESDLVQAYKGLNRLTHSKLMWALEGSGLKPVYRKSHSFVNKYGALKNANLRVFPLDFLITKEFVLLEKAA